MQNVINSMAPFTDPLTGLPISGGRVHFVQLDTDDVTRYIDIKDVDGTSLENPLPLDDSGRFVMQPFADDGVDFKMIVEAPTGHEDPEWSRVGVIFQKHLQIEVDYEGCPVVDSLSELRTLEPENKNAIVLGYGSAGDFCPVRTFVFDENAEYAENYGTHVKSSLPDVSGCWVAKVGDVVDVRWFGINPDSDNNDCSTRLAVISDEYSTDSTVYFPKGDYYLSSSVAFNSVIVEKGSNFRIEGENSSVVFSVVHLENRGGVFHSVDSSDNTSARVVLKTKGLLRTSWLGGSINEFLTSAALADVDELVFDSIVEQGAAPVTISKKTVQIYDGITTNNNITFSDCFVFHRGTGRLDAVEFRIGTINKAVIIDIDKVRLADSASSTEINRSGMVTKNSDESYILNLDYEGLEFINGQKRAELEADSLQIYALGGTGNGSVTLTSNGLDVNKGNDGTEIESDHISVHAEDFVDEFDATIDSNGIKFEKEYSGNKRFILIDGNNIDSTAVVVVNKGLKYPWAIRELEQPAPSQGDDHSLMDISDSVVVEDRVVAKIVKKYNAGIIMNVTAAPTRGRVVRIVYTCDTANVESMDFDRTLLRIIYDGNVLAYLQFGGSFTLVANGSGWYVDYTRL